MFVFLKSVWPKSFEQEFFYPSTFPQGIFERVRYDQCIEGEMLFCDSYLLNFLSLYYDSSTLCGN